MSRVRIQFHEDRQCLHGRDVASLVGFCSHFQAKMYTATINLVEFPNQVLVLCLHWDAVGWICPFQAIYLEGFVWFAPFFTGIFVMSEEHNLTQLVLFTNMTYWIILKNIQCTVCHIFEKSQNSFLSQLSVQPGRLGRPLGWLSGHSCFALVARKSTSWPPSSLPGHTRK